MNDPFEIEGINEKRVEIEKIRRERAKSDLRKVLASAEGRRFVWRILTEGKAFHSCFDLNPIQMAKNEGKRDMALFLMTEIMADHVESYFQMQREAKTLKHARDTELKKSKEEAEE